MQLKILISFEFVFLFQVLYVDGTVAKLEFVSSDKSPSEANTVPSGYLILYKLFSFDYLILTVHDKVGTLYLTENSTFFYCIPTDKKIYIKSINR